MAEAKHRLDGGEDPLAEARRFDAAFAAYLARHCAPIGWLPSSHAPERLLKCKTGTCALVDTGEIKAFVTCEHVWTAWRKYKHKHPSAELLVGLGNGAPLNLSHAELIDCDKDIDLAVIRADVSPEQIRNKLFYPIEEWPIPQPKVGDVVAIVGCPGRGREALGRHITTWALEFLGYGVSGVSDRQITLAPERNDRSSRDEDGNKIPHGNIGGMSGSPAFLLKEKWPPTLVGFVKEGKSSDDFIFLASGRYLQRNGKLRG